MPRNVITSLEKCYYTTDSQIVHSMIQKESYGINTFAEVQGAEVQ